MDTLFGGAVLSSSVEAGWKACLNGGHECPGMVDTALVAAGTEDAEQHEEEVDEVQIERERPDDGVRAGLPFG